MGKIKRSFTMGGGKATLACLILIVITLAFTGCEQPDNTVSSVIAVPSVISVTSVNDPTILHDAEHCNTLQLTATITSSGSSPEFLYWSSSNENIAKVNQRGQVYLPTANYMYGYVEIIAETIDGGCGSIEILVAPPEGYIKDEEDTWKIYTADGLLAWNNYIRQLGDTENTKATLMANIKLPDPEEGQNWEPVGTNSNPYTGTFDGNGYTISNLTIVSEYTDLGLFGSVGKNGTVKNLTLSSDVEISGTDYIGSIAGTNSGTIENCSVSGTVGGSEEVGGIAGYNYGTIENCSVSGTVNGLDRYVGGIVGTNSGTIKNCSVSGKIEGSYYVGGIAGTNSGTIENCSVSGKIEGSYYVGGIAGQNGWNAGTIKNCNVSGTVEGPYNVGGITGENYGTIKNCSISGTVKGEKYVGGISGPNLGTIENCRVTGTVEGSEDVGGIVSDNESGTIIDCYNTGNVVGSSVVGGIVGWNNGGSVTACYNTGTVKGPSDVGGIVGSNSNNDSNNGTITACYNTGEVSGTTSVGGVVGYNSATVNACYWASSIDSGIGEGSGSATKVDGNDVTWETAMNEMNTAFSGYDYEYTQNPDSTTKDTMPLIIVKSSN